MYIYAYIYNKACRRDVKFKKLQKLPCKMLLNIGIEQVQNMHARAHTQTCTCACVKFRMGVKENIPYGVEGNRMRAYRAPFYV